MNYRHFPSSRAAGLAIFAAALLLPATATACLWEYGTAADGSAKVVEGFPPPPLLRAPQPPEEWAARLKALASAPDFQTNLQKRNDYAVALIRLGRSAEAAPILEAIEKANPGRYVTAVNLGTAYELLGKDELALKWIVEGVKRNPQSHAGTEWLHVRILEAKLASKQEPGWLRGHAIFDGGAALTGEQPAPQLRKEPVKDHAGVPRDVGDILKALEYQLGERLQFVKPPEPVVGELLLELASLTALQAHVERAMPAMKMAGEFKPVRLDLHAQRSRHFEGLVRANEKSGRSTNPGSDSTPMIVLATALFCVLLAGYLFVRSRRIRKSSPPAPH